MQATLEIGQREVRRHETCEARRPLGRGDAHEGCAGVDVERQWSREERRSALLHFGAPRGATAPTIRCESGGKSVKIFPSSCTWR